MTPKETAVATADAIGGFASHFMLDAATYGYGATIGFEGLGFYFAGRGGVLGDVDASVVSDSFYFFNPDTVRVAWDGSTSVMPRAQAASEFAGCLERWCDRLGGDVDWGRLADLAGRVVAEAPADDAPVFAGWRDLPVPDAPVLAAAYQMNGLRELRNARHGAAVMAAGLAPVEAVLVKTPYMAAMFGWTEDLPDVSDRAAAWDTAEDATNAAMGEAFAVLDDAEQAEFTALANAAGSAAVAEKA